MQNLIVGKSGAGKGYEVCAFHILTALSQGRKVITNMPLVLEKWGAIDPTFPHLIEMRKRAMPIRGTWEPTREEGAYHLFTDQSQAIMPPSTARAFAGVWDYYSTWKHPDTQAGPLFVVDEAQNVIPRGNTSVEVEEWTALHRHFTCDVLFVTQSYGKLSQAVRDNIQIVYRLTKKIAWGQPNKYIRKVQDGIRGEVLNTTERTYNPAYFGLWVSHTQGGTGEEYGANDIVPLWRHWTFMGAGVMAVLAVILFSLALTSESGAEKAARLKAEHVVEFPVNPQLVQQPVQQAVQEPAAQPRGPEKRLHPYEGFTMHLAALMQGHRAADGPDSVYLNGYVAIAQNGQPVSRVSFEELREAGYTITRHSNRVISLVFQGYDVGYVVDDLPTVKITGTGTSAVPTVTEG